MLRSSALLLVACLCHETAQDEPAFHIVMDRPIRTGARIDVTSRSIMIERWSEITDVGEQPRPERRRGLFVEGPLEIEASGPDRMRGTMVIRRCLFDNDRLLGMGQRLTIDDRPDEPPLMTIDGEPLPDFEATLLRGLPLLPPGPSHGDGPALFDESVPRRVGEVWALDPDSAREMADEIGAARGPVTGEARLMSREIMFGRACSRVRLDIEASDLDVGAGIQIERVSIAIVAVLPDDPDLHPLRVEMQATVIGQRVETDEEGGERPLRVNNDMQRIVTYRPLDDAAWVDAVAAIDQVAAELAERVIDVPEWNYRLRVDPAWVEQPDESEVVRTMLVRPDPATRCVVVVEQLLTADFDTTRLVANSLALLAARFEDVDVASREALETGGMQGRLLHIDIRHGPAHTHLTRWLCVHHGLAFQISIFGDAADRDVVVERASELLAGLELIDPDLDRTPAERRSVRSEPFGFEIRTGGSPWTAHPQPETVYGYADHAVSRAEGAIGLVIPVCLQGTDPDTEMVDVGLLEILGRVPGEFGPAAPVELSGATGRDVRFDFVSEGQSFRHRVLTLRHGNFAYLVWGWALTSTGEADRLIDDFVDRVVIQPPDTEPEPGGPSVRSRASHRDFFNAAGLAEYRRGRYEDAGAYFERGFAAAPDDAVLLGNVVEARRRQRRPADAERFLEAHLDRFEGNQSLRVTHAELAAEGGRIDDALARYEAVFAAGHRDDESFRAYVELIFEHRPIEAALESVRDYLAAGASLDVELLETDLLRIAGDLPGAVQRLRDMSGRMPTNADVAARLVSALVDHEQHHEAMERCERLLAEGYDTAEVRVLKGRAELGLGWQREAKASFATALERDPAHTDARQWHDHVSVLTGEGENALVRDPIEPVPLPDLPETAPGPAPSGAADADAWYPHRSLAISFVPGEDLRYTSRLMARVNSSVGVTQLSTLMFAFDPIVESMYVNELVVRGPDGAVVRRGAVSEYYVTSEGGAAIASQDRVLHVPVAGLRPGHSVALTLTRRRLEPPDDMPFLEWSPATDLEVGRSVLHVTGAVGGVAHATSRAGLTPRAENGDAGLTWVVDTPAPLRWESAQPRFHEFTDVVWLGSAARSWAGVASAYLDRISKRLRTPGTELADLAHDVIGDTDDPVTRLERLAAHVTDGYAYKAILFGPRALVPNPAETIVANGYGDCKDHALLLHQMLQAAGVPSHLALVNSGGLLREEMPTLEQFDHMIVYVPDPGGRGGPERARFVDCTSKRIDPSLPVPDGLGGARALVLDPDEARLVDIGDYPGDVNEITVRTDVRIGDDGATGIVERVEVRGYLAAWLRRALLAAGTEHRSAQVHAMLAAALGDVRLESCRFENLDASVDPLVIEVAVTRPSGVTRVRDSVLIRLPAAWARIALDETPGPEPRRTPLSLVHSIRVRGRTFLHVPAGHAAGGLKELSSSGDGGIVRHVVGVTAEGDAVVIEYDATRRTGKFPADAYEGYVASCRAALDAIAAEVVIEQTD